MPFYRRCFLFLVIVSMPVAGCTVWRPMPFKAVPLPSALPAAYQHYYDYPALPLEATVIKEEIRRGYIFRRVEIPFYLPDELRSEDPAELKKRVEEMARTNQKGADDERLLYVTRIDYYIPWHLKPGEKRPAILISSILGGTMVVDHFAQYYAGRGYVAALVHRKKLYWKEGEDFKQVEDYMRASVIRLREAVDWLGNQPEVDASRIGAFGISYGAILHSILAAVDDRIRFHILAMPAGELADVILECPDKAITKIVKKVHMDLGYPIETIRREIENNVVTDPILLAPYVPKNKIQIYISLFDRVVGAKRSWHLWKAMGKPSLRVMPFGHYGGVMILPYLQTASYSTFKKHLKKTD